MRCLLFVVFMFVVWCVVLYDVGRCLLTAVCCLLFVDCRVLATAWCCAVACCLLVVRSCVLCIV